MKRIEVVSIIIFLGMSLTGVQAAQKTVPNVRDIYAEFMQDQPPLEFTLISDRIVTSEEDPKVTLRRVEGRFVSQMVFGKPLTHHPVMLIPTDKRLIETPERRGKVVIVGSIRRHFNESFLVNYGYPIATKLGYPTMILPNPGSTPDNPDREWSIRNLWAEGVPRVVTNNYYFRLAIPYLRAMDVFADTLGIPRDRIRAVIGGHSKRAPSAYTAAAIRPDNIAGVVFMGMEGRWGSKLGTINEPVAPVYNQRFVKAKCIYLGATNEDGYTMFNVTHNQKMLDKPWIVSMVPNYRHAAESPQQFIIWRMFVSHVFDERPVAKISDVSHEETDKGIFFRARIDNPNRIVQVRAWYAYCDDVPLWRDIVWYPVVMLPVEGQGNLYQGYEMGKTPDAWFVEVEDIAKGVHGYVTSCPQNITGKPAEERTSRGSRSRHWEEK
jgi:pimeloyl-ACP methyl ester carboxylesterase